jgi:hypothetical protein
MCEMEFTYTVVVLECRNDVILVPWVVAIGLYGDR